MLRASLAATFIAAAAVAAAPIGVSADTKEAGQYVDLAPVAMPVVVSGKLINYVFVYVRVDLTSGADMPKWRDKEPYFRDALVRAGYRTPFTRPDDYTQLDEGKLKATMFQLAQQITGPGAVAAIEILPGGGPMHRAGLPKPQLGPPPERPPEP